jgi:hypothetical protein
VKIGKFFQTFKERHSDNIMIYFKIVYLYLTPIISLTSRLATFFMQSQNINFYCIVYLFK